MFCETSKPARSSSPPPTSIFFLIFFFTIYWSQRFITGGREESTGWKEKGHMNPAILNFYKCHRNSLRIQLGYIMNASRDIKGTLSTQGFSEFPWQGHAGPDSICCFVILAFCPFKWLHIILYLHVPWLFPFNLFQLISSIDF